MALSQERNIVEKLKLEQKYSEDELALKRDTFLKAQKLRRDNFIASANSQAEIDDANNTYKQMELQAEDEHGKGLKMLKAKNASDTNILLTEIREKYALDSQEATLARMNVDLDVLNELLDAKDPRSLAIMQEKQVAVWEAEDEAFDADMDRKMTKLQEEGYSLSEAEGLIHLERMDRQAQRNLDEVEMETAKIESIKAVRMEYIGWLSSIGSTMKKLSKDNEGLAKAAVIVEKSAATAKVIASTQAANQDIISTSSSASGEAIAKGTASVAAGAVAIAAGNPQGVAMQLAGKSSIATETGIATAAKGKILKNNIGAGLAIANIWAESQGSSGDAGGSGGSGGGNTFMPSFNVVGNSETNQLAESIGGQVNSPTQAYVVYEDIQTAQQLESNAIEASGI